MCYQLGLIFSPFLVPGDRGLTGVREVLEIKEWGHFHLSLNSGIPGSSGFNGVGMEFFT